MAERCVAGQDYTITFPLEAAGSSELQAAPTIDAANDFKISVNGGALTALTNAPTVSPAGSAWVALVLDATETTAAGAGGYISVQAVDASGGEWKWVGFHVPVHADDVAEKVALAAVDTVVDGIKAVTDALPDAGALTTIDGNVEAILADTGTDGVVVAVGSKAGYSLAANQSTVTVGTVNALATDAVNAAAFAADAIAEINATVDAALTDYGASTATEMTAAFTEIKGATWTSTDTLEAILDRGDAAWATATGFSTHSAADVRSEVDSNSTQLAAIVADTNELQTDLADGGRLDLILDATATQASVDDIDTVVDAILDDTGTTGVAVSSTGVAAIWAQVIEGSHTALRAMRILLAVMAGKSNGGGTTTINFRDTADSKNRVTAVVDDDGNRTSTTIDGT